MNGPPVMQVVQLSSGVVSPVRPSSSKTRSCLSGFVTCSPVFLASLLSEVHGAADHRILSRREMSFSGSNFGLSPRENAEIR